ncbi:hypothetical protein GGTG_03986 [Gaeumannomyces tritici R3-111a-1]|uniref:Sm domain-containing protein n=1 Tax=Gaeumannomyces tritici (strain R3-111a-1) TaxID=644352 RepID=J3NRT7_GAET3|nr:hypothetical protein GGTG_03986 [Gaeumannomyces tritici R3-111a-1]EJT78893.1 hypothetical protein GGTG_03986 [Gaeumannomyces tritici R3-111a-1]
MPMMDEEASAAYLASLLNKNLRITTTDTRMFWGQFKCTDPDCNVVLAHAYEYRHPTAEQVAEEARRAAAAQRPAFNLDMNSRFLGLIVVPGEHIVKIEVEEFASQMRGTEPATSAALNSEAPIGFL